MPKATHRLKRFNRKKHKNGQFRHRPLTIREVERAQRGFLLTKEEAAIVSGRCRQCRDSDENRRGRTSNVEAHDPTAPRR